MGNLPDWLKTAGLLIGVPVYLYILLRWMTSAIVRSYFEIKQEFQSINKKEVL